MSPDGANLAYLSGPYSNDILPPADVVVVALDSAGDPEPGSWRVLLEDAVGSCPQWSPDGRSLAVVAEGQESEATEPPDELRVVALDGKERVLALVPAYAPNDFAWSPDGDAVAYLTEDAVWITPLDGSQPELLWRSTSTPDADPGGMPLLGAPQSLSWLGTGELAVSVFAGFTDVGQDEVLHIVDVKSGRREMIELNIDGGAVWSPDGSRLVVASESGNLRVYDRTDGSTVRLRPKLEQGGEMGIYGVAWSPDGDRRVAGAARRPASSGPAFALVSMAPDGTSIDVLTPWTSALYWTGLKEHPTWSPR